MLTSRRFPRATFPALLTAVLAIGAVALALNDRFKAEADGPDTSWSVDADTGNTGVQTALSVPVGTTFSVDVLVDSLAAAAPAWQSWQTTLDYDDVELDGTGIPANWGNAPTATTGGNLFVFPGGAACDPSPTAQPSGTANARVNEDDIGSASWAVTCFDSQSNVFTTTGSMVRLFFLCEVAGEAALTLRDAADTFLLGTDFSSLNDHQHNATITCVGAATNTPTSTNTSAPPTEVPTNTPTNTNTSTATATNTSGPSDTDTPTPTNTTPPSDTDTPTATNTAGPNDTDTPTPTNTTPPSDTDTPTATNTAGPNDTDTPTPTNTTPPSDTDTPTPTNTSGPSDTDTPTPTNTTPPSDTDTPTNTPVPPTDTPVPPTNTPAPTNTTTPGGCKSDLNGDGKVTGRDVSAVARAMSRPYDAKYDLNHDNKVNLKDLKIVIVDLIRTHLGLPCLP